MGRKTTRTRYYRWDDLIFSWALRRERDIVLQRWHDDPRLRVPGKRFGTETELTAFDLATGDPFTGAWKVAQGLAGWQTELGQFNGETGDEPLTIGRRMFGVSRARLQADLLGFDHALAPHGAMAGMFGVMPSLRMRHMRHIVRSPRFDTLSASFDRIYGDWELDFDVEGAESMHRTGTGIDVEAFTTTRQIHIDSSVTTVVRDVNAALIAAVYMIALSGNSPFVDGKQVSHNCARLRVFFDSIRHRGGEDGLGPDWVRTPRELLDRALAEPVIIPEWKFRRRKRLLEITLHLGTTYPLVRIVIADDHIRIEVRYLPCGLTVDDMIANDAALLAMIKMFGDEIDQGLWEDVPFQLVRDNFRAARDFGADVKLTGRDGWVHTAREFYLRREDDLVAALTDGLGCEEHDAVTALEPMRQRVTGGPTASEYLIHAREEIGDAPNPMGTLTQLTSHMARSGLPVGAWPHPAEALQSLQAA